MFYAHIQTPTHHLSKNSPIYFPNLFLKDVEGKDRKILNSGALPFNFSVVAN